MSDKITQDDLLQPYLMLNLYSRGYFPMGDDNGDVDWYTPHEHCIIPLHSYNFPRSLKKFMQTSNFTYRFSTQVLDVIDNCSNREETWIVPRLKEAYKRIYQMGYVHSVETWQEDRLVGGLYGIAINSAFLGESMFSIVSQASKCALIILIEHLNKKGFQLLDVQLENPHLKMFRTNMISEEEYLRILSEAVKKQNSFL